MKQKSSSPTDHFALQTSKPGYGPALCHKFGIGPQPALCQPTLSNLWHSDSSDFWVCKYEWF